MGTIKYKDKMSGGQTSSNQNNNSQINLGGNINGSLAIGGSVMNGPAQFNNNQSATGASTDLKFSMDQGAMGGMGMGMGLNLNQLATQLDYFNTAGQVQFK